MFNRACRLPVLLPERVLPVHCLAQAAVSMPLCERPGRVHGRAVASLLQWHEWAAVQSRETRDELAEDGGPTATGAAGEGTPPCGRGRCAHLLTGASELCEHVMPRRLQKDLDWLLDDAVEACCGPGMQRCRAWRDVKRCSAGRAQGCSISLRLQLQDLGELWRRRLQGTGVRAQERTLCPGARGGAAPTSDTYAVCRTPLQYLCNVAHWRDSTLASRGSGRTDPAAGDGAADKLCPGGAAPAVLTIAAAAAWARLHTRAAHAQALQRHPELGEGAWADLGTGSGALAVGLAAILPPGSPVLAVECSPERARLGAAQRPEAGLHGGCGGGPRRLELPSMR